MVPIRIPSDLPPLDVSFADFTPTHGTIYDEATGEVFARLIDGEWVLEQPNEQDDDDKEQ